jgi:hypothetical protein
MSSRASFKSEKRLISFTFLRQFSQNPFLILGQVFLFILAKQIKQADLLIPKKIDVKIPQAAAFAFVPGWVRSLGLADAAKPSNYRASNGIPQQI